MEKWISRSIIGLTLSFCLINAQQRMATVSGNAFLTDSTDHSGVKVLFEAVSASATTDSVYSGSDGTFIIGLTDGLYIVHYSKNGFIPYTLPTTYSWGNDTYTLPDVTLNAGNVIEVSGDVFGTWYSNSLIQVTGDITIPDRQTLTIEPGVTVHFMDSYRWYINGTIFAVGTETDTIFITSGQPIKSSTDWKGIYIYGQGEADTNRTLLFQFVDIGYGGTENALFYVGYLYGRVPFQFLNSTLHDHANSAINSSYSNSIIHESGFNLTGNSPFEIYDDYGSEIIGNHIITSNYYLFSYYFNGASDSYKTTISNNYFDLNYGFGELSNNRSSGTDTLIFTNNILNGHYSDWSSDFRTESNNFTLIESNQFEMGFNFSSNDESIFRNNFVNSSVVLNSNSSPTIENNIFQSGTMDFYGNNGAATIAYNTFVNYSNLDDSDAPIGLGTILTTNANGHDADTYLNIFETPLFVPSDSTVKMSYEIIDSVMYLAASPSEEWGEINYIYWQFRSDYNDYYYCCNNTYLYRELIDNEGRSWQSRNQQPSIATQKDQKEEGGNHINEYTIEDYEEITPNNRHLAFGIASARNRDNNRTESVDIVLSADGYYYESSWNLYNYSDSSYYWTTNRTFTANYETDSVNVSLEDGLYSVDVWDSWGDGGVEGYVKNSADSILVSWTENSYSSFGEFGFGLGPLGCTDATALNYDSNALIDDGSCYYYYGSTCDGALQVVEGNNTVNDSVRWFEYTATIDGAIHINYSDDQYQYIYVYDDCNGDQLASSEGESIGITLECEVGDVFKIYWDSGYSISGSLDWYFLEGVWSDTYYASFDITDNYSWWNTQYPPNRQYVFWYTMNGNGYYYYDLENVDFAADPSAFIYMEYSDDLDPNSPTIDAGNPDAALYDPDGTVADIGHSWYNQGNVAAPTADFSANTTSGSAPTFVEFSFTGSGAVTGYSWNFGDGATSTSFRPVHRYEEGTYSVSLTVTGPGGEDTEIKTDYIVVSSPSTPPVVSFYADATTGIVPFTVQFHSTVHNGFTSLSWDFGDGNTSTEANPSHTYSTSGDYTVALTATNDHGSDTQSLTDYIHALDPSAVVADFAASPVIGVAPLAVAFTNNSVGTIDSVLWELGDGNESRLTSPVHTYNDPGMYSVELTVFGVVNSDSLFRDSYVAVYDEKPIISSIIDVPNDQGGQVLLSWNPSGWDGPVGSTITQYSLWEKYNNQWVNINTAMANQSQSYLFLANTFGDSSESGTHWAFFKIIAHTADPAVFYESPVDSGYSLDNIAPEAPGTLLATTDNNNVNLEWGTSNESNFMYYEVVRNDEVIAQLTENNYNDANASFPMPSFYHVQSVDDAGNISPPTNTVNVNMTNMDWYLHISAELQSGENDQYNFIGVAEDATNGFDESYDIYEPPVPPGNYVTVSFYIDDTTASQNTFAQLVNPSIDLSDTMQVWDMYVSSNVSDTAYLSFDLNDISGFPIILEDVSSSIKYEINENNSFEFYAIADSQYHFMVSIGDTTAPLLVLGSSCSGPAILNSGESYEFDWSLYDGSSLDSVMFFISLDSGNTYDTYIALSSEESSFNWTVPNIPLNYGGMVKIVANDYTGNMTEKESDYVFAIANDTLSINVSSGWTLFGLPLEPEDDNIVNNLEDDFSGYWYVYGFENGGYVFDSTFSVGNGFWLASMENTTVDIIGEPNTETIDIDLNAGWNLVNDPYVLDMSIDSLLIINQNDSSSYYFDEAVSLGLINSAYSYDGNGYVEANVFHSWDGFWLGSLTDNLTLRLPIHRHNGSDDGNRVDENNWMISFEGKHGSAFDLTTVLGVNENSTDDFDPAFDVVKAPLPPGNPFVSLYFLHDDWDLILGDKIAKDIRSPIQLNESKQWSVHVNSNSDNVIVKWEMLNIPDEYEVGINLDGGDYFSNIDEFDSLTVLDGSILTIRVGYNVLGIGNVSLLPEVFALHQNYPNPFNPTTTLRYDLPEDANVDITIYDMLGRTVKTMTNKNEKAGFKSVIWDATNNFGKPVSAGVYLYRINAGDFVQTKKMVLLK